MTLAVGRDDLQATAPPRASCHSAPHWFRDARVEAMPPIVALAPGSIGKNRPWSRRCSLSCSRRTPASTVQSKSSALTAIIRVHSRQIERHAADDGKRVALDRRSRAKRNDRHLCVDAQPDQCRPRPRSTARTRPRPAAWPRNGSRFVHAATDRIAGLDALAETPMKLVAEAGRQRHPVGLDVRAHLSELQLARTP